MGYLSVQLLSCIQIFATPWTAAHQACLSVTNSQSLLKLMSTESVMPSNHLILCRPLLLLLLLPLIYRHIYICYCTKGAEHRELFVLLLQLFLGLKLLQNEKL